MKNRSIGFLEKRLNNREVTSLLESGKGGMNLCKFQIGFCTGEKKLIAISKKKNVTTLIKQGSRVFGN
jgi:hypothetical protein